MSTENRLYYGDNLDILRQHEYFPNACVDLVYLDPPFNSSRDYNVLFRDESGQDSEAQITAFEDTWHWGQAAQETYEALITQAPDRVAAAVSALHTLVGTNQMLAYLVMMTARLVELHRVLKPTGSLYLHCDPTASHYLKIILDAIFGPASFRAEIIWKRTSAHSDTKQGAKQPGRIHDVIFFYSKDAKVWTWNPIFTDYDSDYLESNYNKIEPKTGRRFKSTDLTAAKPGGDTLYDWKGKTPSSGRFWAYSKENMEKFEVEDRLYYTSSGFPRLKQYLDEMPGVHIQSIWDDISPISSQAKERLGYPTQKPLSLLERIVAASSNPGDVVLDPFCGCGTAIAAAQKLGRHWLGIDITHLSVALMKYRLRDMFDLTAKVDYAVIGEPTSISGARQLAQDDRFQFQFWAASLVQAQPLGGQEGSKKGKKGKDGGIDGVIRFFDSDGKKQTAQRVLVQVKSGKVGAKDLRDLRGTLEREAAAIGVFITLEAPTQDMLKEALTAGVYESPVWGKSYRKLQILTIEELLIPTGKRIDMPPQHGTFKQAERVKEDGPRTLEMFED